MTQPQPKPEKSGTLLFGRRYSLDIAAPTDLGAAQYGNESEDATALRVTFSVRKDTTIVSNPATITIWNMNQQNRAAVQKGFAVNLFAGYAGLTDLLYAGQVARVKTAREGPDIGLEMECEDGQGPLCLSQFDRNYPAGANLTDILNDVLDVMSTATSYITFPVSEGVIAGLPTDKTYPRGIQFHGSCSKALHRLLNPLGFDFYVHNNALHVIAKTQHLDDGVVYLSADTGLIGNPSRNAQNGVTSFLSLLNPRIVPGRLVYLQSVDNAFDGYYRAQKVEFQGDTHGEQWAASVEAIPFPDQNSAINAPEG